MLTEPFAPRLFVSRPQLYGRAPTFQLVTPVRSRRAAPTQSLSVVSVEAQASDLIQKLVDLNLVASDGLRCPIDLRWPYVLIGHLTSTELAVGLFEKADPLRQIGNGLFEITHRQARYRAPKGKRG